MAQNQKNPIETTPCEVMFRGCRKGKNEFVYGSLVAAGDDRFIVTWDGIGHLWAEVEPATVSQYTNKQDRHGTKIFTSDIVGWFYGSGTWLTGEVVFNKRTLAFEVEWDSVTTTGKVRRSVPLATCEGVKVVGDAHKVGKSTAAAHDKPPFTILYYIVSKEIPEVLGSGSQTMWEETCKTEAEAWDILKTGGGNTLERKVKQDGQICCHWYNFTEKCWVGDDNEKLPY